MAFRDECEVMYEPKVSTTIHTSEADGAEKFTFSHHHSEPSLLLLKYRSISIKHYTFQISIEVDRYLKYVKQIVYTPLRDEENRFFGTSENSAYFALGTSSETHAPKYRANFLRINGSSPPALGQPLLTISIIESTRFSISELQSKEIATDRIQIFLYVCFMCDVGIDWEETTNLPSREHCTENMNNCKYSCFSWNILG